MLRMNVKSSTLISELPHPTSLDVIMSYPYKSKVLERLGVLSWINARGSYTTVGGSWIDDRVLSAMDEVAKTFVDMRELFAKADERIANLCHVDDAHIVAGAGAAIELSVAGCMAGKDYAKWISLPCTDGMKNEVVMSRGQYIQYSQQWVASGAKLVEYGYSTGQTKSQLEAAISEKTCCLSYTVSWNTSPKRMISLEEVVETGKKRSIPVVVDSAAMLPPTSNLHKFTDMNADIACFSGGKAIRASNNTGLILGNGNGAEIIASIRNNSFPNDGWGRGHKISKEQVVGLVVALEIFLEEGDLNYEKQMETAKYFLNELSNIPDVEVAIIPNDENFY